jgi:hypothetical protein
MPLEDGISVAQSATAGSAFFIRKASNGNQSR